MLKYLLIVLLAFPTFIFANEELLRALEIADYWDRKDCERFPTTFNHILSTGYFTTHSARMTEDGNVAVGVATIPPYLHWNARIQPFSFLELSANYRIFRGFEDPNLGVYGFGDYADRGANFKVALVTPEQSRYRLPGLAFGIDDFMGSKKFLTYYLVGTHVCPDYGFEVSLGWGAGRYTHGPSRGFFGGFNWFPWIQWENRWTKGFCLSAELDPTNYSDPDREPHPKGRETHSLVNYGIKYKLFEIIELSASHCCGDRFAFAGSLQYNWGRMEGFLPKIDDPLPYTNPVNREPLGCYRPEEVMMQSLQSAFKNQGFQITKAWMEDNTGKTSLWICVINRCYRQECLVRKHIEYLLAALIPSNIDEIVVLIESYGVVCQKYVYRRDFLLMYRDHCMSPFEFYTLSPRENVSFPDACFSRKIFNRRNTLCRFRPSPRFENFLGCATGKYKYDLGVQGTFEGFLPYDLYYEFQLSRTLASSIRGLCDVDLFSPSQLPIVATDYIRYRQTRALSWDMLYLQKSHSFGSGFFGRIAGGYFQVNYGGLAGELLWYPADRYLAIGLEGALVKKRRYNGLGFQSKLRQMEGFTPHFFHYDFLAQYFLSFYFDFPDLRVFTKISVGQFLARDIGGRFEVTRYFDNGIRLTGWMTATNGNDIVHGERYFDRGITVEMPFDLFYKCSSRRVWNYGMAAWLRDAGYVTTTGKPLFDIINRERR